MRSSAQDLPALRDELGDLLFQVVFQSRMARGAGRVRFRRCGRARSATSWSGAIRMSSAARKSTMRRRRPSRGKSRSGCEREHAGRERSRRRTAGTACTDARQQARASGLRWSGSSGQTSPARSTSWSEELGELRDMQLSEQAGPAEITDELGDVLFCIVNVCRYLGVDPEVALRWR